MSNEKHIELTEDQLQVVCGGYVDMASPNLAIDKSTPILGYSVSSGGERPSESLSLS